jgi:hypothetical protein
MTQCGYRLGVVVGLLALALAACTSGSSGSPNSETTARATLGASLSTEPGSSTPLAEGNGPETPLSPGSGGGGELDLPNLPIGGAATDATCVDVSWLGNPIPHGDVVKVTAVHISHPFMPTERLTSDCSSAQACDGGYVFIDNRDSSCGVGFAYPGGPIDPNGEMLVDGTVQIDGQLSCPAGDSSACDAAARDIKSAGGTQVTIEVHVASSSSSAPVSSPATGSPPG